jgi:nucleoid-associated protein YgaU
MGLFDFVASAGDKIFGDDEKKEDVTTVSPERVNELREQRITKMIGDAGLQVENLKVKADGELVTLEGNVKNQQDSEKATLTAGNQYGISRVDNRLAVESAEPEATFYTVKSGDSLSKIAKEFYGSANKYMVIFEANKPLLSDPNKIYPGQTLRIPAA